MIMAKEWKYGYEQLVYFVNQNENNYDKIIFTNESGESYMYYLFFKPYPPDLIQNKLKFDEVDKFGIGHVYKIDNIEFRSINRKKEILLPRILWIGDALEIPENDNRLNYLKTIYYPNGRKAFVAVDLKSKGQDETRQFQKKDELKLIYSWGECNELGKREELEVNNENKINYRLNINGKPVDEIKLKISDSESKLIWREIPMDLLENKEINIKIEDINFCNQLNVYKNEKFLRVNMKGKSSPQFDNLLLLLNRLKIKYFNK